MMLKTPMSGAGLALLLSLIVVCAAPAVAAQDVTACDRLATHSLDPAGVAPGVSRGDIDLPVAIDTCRTDLEADPGNARVRYQYARVLFYSGRFDEAMVEMRAAADGGHAQAQFVYGVFVVKERPGAPTDMCIAERNWQAASEGGRHAAAVHYATQRLRGIFDGCSDLASFDEMTRWLTAAHVAAPDGYGGYYRRLFIEDLQHRLNVAAGV